MTLSGRPVTAASEPIGIDEVFEARTASTGSVVVRPPEDVLLDGEVLDDGLDHQVGWDEVVDGLDATEHLVGIGSPLLRELGGASSDRLERRARSPPARRRATRPPARGRRDLRDAAAHLAGADDEDMLELHAAAG